MMTLAIVISVLIVIALLRFGVSVEYSSEGVIIKLRAGPFSIQIFPTKENPYKERKKTEKKALRDTRKKTKPKKEPVKKKPGMLSVVLDTLPLIKNMLDRVKRRLLIKKLIIHFTAAGDDPSKTAMIYGTASAVFGTLTPILENNFRIKRRDFQTNVDFINQEQKIYIYAIFSLAVWETLYIVFALFPIIRILGRRKPVVPATSVSNVSKDRKENEEHGKTSNK